MPHTETICNPQVFAEGAKKLTSKKVEDAAKQAMRIIDGNLETFKTKFPSHNSENLYYLPCENCDYGDGWNTGFWTGILWLAYELSGNPAYRDTALGQIPSFHKRIAEKIGVNHHDMGFLYSLSCVAAYRLVKDPMAKEAALLAADHLASRFREQGNFIQAWGNLDDETDYRLIIDCLMNIPLLYWASESTGKDTYSEMASKHFDTTMSCIFREDGSTHHTYYFSKKTGEPVKGVTHQGYSDDSCWARGQAWSLYGIPLNLKYRSSEQAIPFFHSAAAYFLNRLPEDFVPYWDLYFTSGTQPRDSSAASIALCGILEMLPRIEDEALQKIYRDAADAIMSSLIDDYAVKDGMKSNGLLLHGTYHYKGNIGVDECTIWGDYFYMEALTRYLKSDWELYW